MGALTEYVALSMRCFETAERVQRRYYTAGLTGLKCEKCVLQGCIAGSLDEVVLTGLWRSHAFLLRSPPLLANPDDRPWKDAATEARNHEHRIVCGPTGANRDELAAEYRRANPLAGVPPGSILRPRYE